MKVYLSGASKCLKDEGNNWRKECEELVEQLDWDMDVVNPNTFFNYSTMIPDTEKQCMTCLLHHVTKSDIILCNLDYTMSSVGTGIELGMARALGIPVIGFGKGIEVYGWAEEMCDCVFDSAGEALSYIYSYY